MTDLYPRSHRLLDQQDALLLVVDLQAPFVNAVADAALVLDRSALLIKASTILGVPIVATTQNASRMGGFVDPIQSLLPSGTPVLDKMSFSCMGVADVRDTLNHLDRRQILICGVETHICVLQTAFDLLQVGYDVHLAADSVSSRSLNNHQFAIQRMANAGVEVTVAESAIYEMLQEAGGDAFRQILKLVR